RQLDGTQIKSGFCSSQIMGQIPSTEHMTTSFILSPENGEVLKAHKNFIVEVKINHLKTGHFSNPEKEYYLLPQTLDNGIIEGHSHIVIQPLRSEDDAPDARDFVAFEGLNSVANKGTFKQEFKGLPA
ncbi:18892_t:CDS:1, partial [Racocetra fulgida]